jgi:hypothetical protein
VSDLEDWQEDAERLAIEFVRLGYGDIILDSPFRSMNFTTDELPSRLVVPAIREVKEHNAFEGEAVADGLSRFAGRLSYAEFGRRGSPILWLQFPMWTHQREESQLTMKEGVRISESEYEDFKSEAIKTFIDGTHADSWGEHEILSRKLWFWWD